MEAIFGSGEFFDIKDDIKDVDGNPLDVEMLKLQMMEDFKRDKLRKHVDQVFGLTLLSIELLHGFVVGVGIALAHSLVHFSHQVTVVFRIHDGLTATTKSTSPS